MRCRLTQGLLAGVVLLLIGVFAPPHLEAITFNDSGFFSETVATLAPFKPVGLTFAPDGRMFIWQRDGVIRIVKNGVLLPTPFLNFSSKVNTYTDHGFLGVALDPNFVDNGFVYVFYTYEAGGNPNSATPKTGHLSRVTADPNNPDVMLANSEVILLGTLDVPPCSNYPVGADCFPTDSYTHSVGSLRFLPDGTLLASHGDGASASFPDVLALRSQHLDSYAGKIIRIKPDGSPPTLPLTLNPFNDGTNSIRSKVWAYGLRNPFRFGVHPTTGLPFIGDVGWNTWEEVNKGAPGGNYGWPCFEGNTPQPSFQTTFPVDCQAVPASAVTMPIYTYDHSLGSAAAIGGTFFTGTQYPTPYVGTFFFADYPRGWMKRVVFDGSGTVQSVVDFASNILDVNATGGPVAIELGPDGLLYYIVFTTGEIARIRNTSGTGSNFPPLAKVSATPSSGYSALNVSFSSAGSLDPEGGGLTYLWDFGDSTTSTLPNPLHTYSATGVTLFNVHLTVTDTLGKQSTDSLTITIGSMPPVATIDLPAIGAQFTVGQMATYQGSATDPDQGPLPGTSLHWTVLLHHNTHIHPFIDTTGPGGSFPVDNHDSSAGATWAFEFILAATDSTGLTDTKSRTVPVNPPPPSAPVLLYGMNEGSGATLADTSGNGHTGALVNGPAWVAGQATYGQALSFDGVNDAVSVANPSALNVGTSDFTFELWVKRTILGGAQRHLFSKCTATTWVTGCKEFYFKATNQLTFGSFATGDTVSSPIADTNWHHIAVTFTDATNLLNIYVDGALATTATKALEADDASHLVTVGNLIGNNPFSGLLDEVRLYSRALTLAEIQADMATPITPPSSDTTPPSDVTGLTATAVSATQITLSWTAATDNVGVIGYRVERCQGASCTTFVPIATPTTNSYSDTGLTAGTSYRYRVKAVDAATNVSVNYSTVASATTPAAPPDTIPPSNVTGLTATAVSATQITLSWTAATDNVGVIGYRVERCQGASCTTFVPIATPTTNSYSDAGLTTGTSYRYRVKAVDAATNLSLNYSNTASATPSAGTTLVTAYGMNEGSGTTLADASGSGHTGTLVNGPAWVAGQATYGQALSFDGVNDAVSVANPSTLNVGTSDFTFELWVKRTILGGAQRHLFSKCTATTWVTGCKEFYFKATNQLTFGSFATGDTVSSPIADTNWHHIAVTFTDATNLLNIYVDGALATTATKALEADDASHLVTVGNLFGNNPFSGLLDEVRLYSRALTLAEIQADMATPITPPSSDTTPPSDVTGLTATAVSATQITLSWTAATDNVGVIGYRVERCQGTGCSTFVQLATPAGTTFDDTSLTASTSYRYRVKAVDAATNLSLNYSNTTSATPSAGTTLVTAYGMNEGSGATLADASGNGHTGALVNGPAWVAGQATYGQALSFDGVNDAVSVANPSALNVGASDFTLELWVKRTALGGTQRHLFSKCTATTWVTGCKEFYFKATNQLTFGSFATGDTVSSPIADTNWHHIAVTFTDATNLLNIYVDGALATTATKALEADDASHLVTVGNLFGNNPFSGLLDEVRLYSRALTLAEIQADRTAPIVQ